MARTFKRLLSVSTSKWWLGLLCAALVVLCLTEVAQCSGFGSHEVELDSAGLDKSVEENAVSNKLNLTQIPDSSFIYDVSIEDLAHADSYMDGQTVQVLGEVVGDRINAEGEPDFCWITLQSVDKGDAELSIYMPIAATAAIDTYGAYGKRGTLLQVRGTFNLACKDHEGVSELHSENVSIVSKGTVEANEFAPEHLIPGLLLIILGCVLMLVFNYMRERER